MQQSASPQRLVIKVGTSVLTGGGATLDPRRLLMLVQQIAEMHERGIAAALVSSGAIAAGRGALGHPGLGRGIPAKQMLAAVGQPVLMHHYADLFGIFRLHTAQVLLTRGDLTHRQRYLNARDTLNALLQQRVVPIIKENDTVATEEIKVGDNDNLSAMVANLIDADLLVLLTDQPGLFTTDPRSDPEARLINNVTEFDEALWHSAGGAGSKQGTGGMITKLQAAQLATRSGTAVVIAQGSRPGVLSELLGPQGRSVGTWFEPAMNQIESRKRWLLSERPQGTVHVDQGAARILREGGASLLPVGMTRVDGSFERGMIVRVLAPDGHEIARGITNYNATDLAALCGAHSTEIEERLGYIYAEEVIHRDDLVLV